MPKQRKLTWDELTENLNTPNKPGSPGQIGVMSQDSPIMMGRQVFSWFDDLGELTRWYSRWFVPFLFYGRERVPGEWLEHSAKVVAAGEDGDLESVARLLMAFQDSESGTDVKWVGAFDDLISGNSEFAVELRREFWDNMDIQSTEPIPAGRVVEFSENLYESGFG